MVRVSVSLGVNGDKCLFRLKTPVGKTRINWLSEHEEAFTIVRLPQDNTQIAPQLCHQNRLALNESFMTQITLIMKMVWLRGNIALQVVNK